MKNNKLKIIFNKKYVIFNYIYSLLRASTGFSFDAFIAGINSLIIPTTIEIASVVITVFILTILVSPIIVKTDDKPNPINIPIIPPTSPISAEFSINIIKIHK